MNEPMVHYHKPMYVVAMNQKMCDCVVAMDVWLHVEWGFQRVGSVCLTKGYMWLIWTICIIKMDDVWVVMANKNE